MSHRFRVSSSEARSIPQHFSSCTLQRRYGMYDNGKPMHFSRRTILKATGLGALLGMTGGCDALGGVFGRMFAVPPRETTYFTNNSKFYVVNYADSVVSVSREVNIE